MKTTMKNLVGHSKSFFGLKNRNNATARAHDTEFAALFYIRNINIELDKDLAKVLHILKGLENLNKKSKLLFETCCSLNERLLWYKILDRLDNNLVQISKQLDYLRGDTSNKINLNGFLFWEFAQSTMYCITEDYEKLKKIAFFILPPVDKMYFRSSISQVQEETLTATISHLSICKQQFDFIIENTPTHITSESMQNLINKIPTNYTLEEAQKYESDNREIELIQQNNFESKSKHWYSVLNLLPKSTHSSSSEKMMLDK
jgi:hypothetical protein